MPRTAYASETKVSVAQTKADIEHLLSRNGADRFMSGWDEGRAVIAFRMNARHIRFILPLPSKDDPEFAVTPARRYTRTDDQKYAAWEQACRSRWRALYLVVKAKLEAIETGITDFDSEFLAHIVLPDGDTLGNWAKPQLDRAYEIGAMPDLPLLGQGS